jgi:hypothetical protein
MADSVQVSLLLLALVVAAPLHAQALSIAANYHVDQFGYLLAEEKVAVISQAQVGQLSPETFTPGATLEVRRVSDNASVFSAAPVAWNGGATHAQSGDKGWWLDFSAVTTAGEYYIADPTRNLRSYAFAIAADPWRAVQVAAFKVFYYQRCGFAKTAEFAGAWSDGAAYLGARQDTEARSVFDSTNASTARDLRGGWFDAGDYNKYVTFAHGVVHDLLDSYRDYPATWTDDFGIPESGNGLPDLLDEVKWELQWLLRMQESDGGVLNKVGAAQYLNASPPSTATHARYYGRKCSSSTIALASVAARAARIYGAFPQWTSFADSLEAAARSAWSWYGTATQSDACDNGEVKAGDADWSIATQNETAEQAAYELWALTGEATFHDWFKSHSTTMAARQWYWGPYGVAASEALLEYSKATGADATIAANIRSYLNFTATNAGYPWTGWKLASGVYPDLYRAHMPDAQYQWGSNQVRSQLGSVNMAIVREGVDAARNADYRRLALAHLHWLHGTNPLNKLYLSRMEAAGGENSVREFYHGWFEDGTAYDNADTSPIGPAPGYLVGGPNNTFTLTSISPPAGQPPQKAYKEWNSAAQNSWEITEPAIYYQAAYLKLLSAFTGSGGATAIAPRGAGTGGSVSPTMARLLPQVRWSGDELVLPAGVVRAELLDPAGRVVAGVAGDGRAMSVLGVGGAVSNGLRFCRIVSESGEVGVVPVVRVGSL